MRAYAEAATRASAQQTKRSRGEEPERSAGSRKRQPQERQHSADGAGFPGEFAGQKRSKMGLFAFLKQGFAASRSQLLAWASHFHFNFVFERSLVPGDDEAPVVTLQYV